MADRGWTEETIVAEFKKHFAYWQEKLQLRDLDVSHVAIGDLKDRMWVSIARSHEHSNPHAAYVTIDRKLYKDSTRYDVWQTACHELWHALLWPMSYATTPLVDHFSASQRQLIDHLMTDANESVCYKMERIFADIFAADAPPKEIPLLGAEMVEGKGK